MGSPKPRKPMRVLDDLPPREMAHAACLFSGTHGLRQYRGFFKKGDRVLVLVNKYHRKLHHAVGRIVKIKEERWMKYYYVKLSKKITVPYTGLEIMHYAGR